ncbi:metallophosphoesterase [Allokutzneria multivorans]|uniref:Metallophosphoesterase n=1 Tax=Allokutzneria multivorans TaxID=1142134 RepID=A0ABP7SI10_9PSEU
MTTTLLHVSDPHLDGSAARAARLRAVLDLLPPSRTPDAIVITGDIADTGSAGEYAQFNGLVSGRAPWLAVPGNHDDPAQLRGSVLDVGDLRVVGLDTTVPGEDHGVLREDVVEQAIEQAQGARRVVLALHQPPVAIGHAYADPTGLRNPDALARLIERIGTVTAVLCGHVHTPTVSSFAGVPVIVAPGVVSALRLDPDHRPLTNREHAPGLALHRFDDGAVTTTFHYAS